jgi:ribosome maturation factor RimP
MTEGERLSAVLEPLLKEAGLILIDLSVSRRGGAAQVRMTVYSPKGTGTDECAKAHRIAYPVAVELLAHPDPSFEVASPGIDRVLGSPREWAIFRGKGVRVLLHGEADWIAGRIDSVEGGTASLACRNGTRIIEFESVIKARLDPAQEGD